MKKIRIFELNLNLGTEVVKVSYFPTGEKISILSGPASPLGQNEITNTNYLFSRCGLSFPL